MKSIVSFLIVSFLFISCNEVKKESNIEKTPIQEASYKNVEVEIEGMTCEIGCARTIQSKLSKVDGITYSKVNFETKKGQFTYDENKISVDSIVAKINGIAGGDLYTVVKTTEILEIKSDSIS
jgi:Cu+-exporting ATPase